MKNWQKGYDLDWLKFIESEFEPYNRFTYSPFTKYKKNNIAKDLYEKNLHILYDCRWLETISKVSSPITCYHDVEIARKQPGDIIISKLMGSSEGLAKRLRALLHCSVWVQHFAEDPTYDDMLMSLNFKRIGGKVVTSSEIYSFWFRGYSKNDGIFHEIENENRIFPILDPVEKITLKKVGNVSIEFANAVAKQLELLDLEFAKSDLTAYVNKDWSALSLRGYKADPSFIADPNEMPKAWNEKHKGEIFQLQDTPLFDHFPNVRNTIEHLFPNTEIHRVTFMRMKPNGVLQRHTDQIDWNHGLSVGKLVRFHFPIKTNENVSFLAWETDGNLLECNLKVGEFWVLDTRKPHKVIVKDDQERIHLTVDLRVNFEIREMMLA